jgi:hypothetical protein
MVIGTIIGYDFRGQDLDEVEQENARLTETLESVGQLNEEEWQAHREATATALLLADAYFVGGIEKATEILEAVERSSNSASAKRDAINELLLRFGFSPDSEVTEN